MDIDSGRTLCNLGSHSWRPESRKCDSVDGSKLIPPKTHSEIVNLIDRAECQAANANRHEAGSIS
jgi:hypothetical protein